MKCEEPASDVLKLYLQTMIPHPHTDVSVPTSSAVSSSTGATQTDGETKASDLSYDLEQRCHDKVGPALGISQLAAENRNSQDPDDLLAAKDGPQPLQPSSITVGELHKQVRGKVEQLSTK